MNGKIKWIIITVVAVIILGIIAIAVINNMQLQYNIEEIKEYNYFVFTREGKYGVIDKNGNVIIEPNYVAVQIPNPSKPVFVCINNYNQETKEYEAVVYNEKKETLFNEYQNIQAIPIDTNIETNPYEKSTLIYKKDEKYGLITLDGKKVTNPIYEEISSISYKEGTFLVKQEEKFGVINLKGKTIIKNEYETITSDNYYNETTKNKTTGFIVSKKTQDGYRYGYIDYKGNMILKPEYTELERITQIPNEKEYYFIAFKNGQAGLLKNKKLILNYEYEDIQYHSLNDIFIVQRNGKQGAVTKEGNNILNTEYDNISFGGIYLNASKQNQNLIFDLQGNEVKTKMISMTKTENPNYYIAIDQNDIYTIVDASGNTLVDNNYTYIEYLPGNYFIVARDGKNGIIDITGKSVVELKYTSIFRFNDTSLLQAEITENNTIELYNMKMQKVASMEHAEIKQYDKSDMNSQKYILLASEKDFAYYDENGNKLDAKNIFTNNTLFAKKVGNQWGFVDLSDNMQVQAQYDMVTDFNNYGFAGIQKDGKWGVIDKKGNIIQEPTYQLDWLQPSFLGKCYRINSWYADARYSDDIIKSEENNNYTNNNAETIYNNSNNGNNSDNNSNNNNDNMEENNTIE